MFLTKAALKIVLINIQQKKPLTPKGEHQAGLFVNFILYLTPGAINYYS
jgi:hypothetical protein